MSECYACGKEAELDLLNECLDCSIDRAEKAHEQAFKDHWEGR